MAESERIVHVLKRLLRSRGITYARLAELIGLSEPSIKRIFSRGTLTLARLEAICAALGTSMHEVARLASEGAQHAAGDGQTLTEAQEQELATDARLLACFHLLANGHDPREIARRMHADERQLRRWLVRLDALGLVTLEPRMRVRLRVSPAIAWRSNGPVRKLYEQQVREEFLRAPFESPGAALQFRSAELSEASCKLLARRLERILSEFADLAELDRGLPPKEKVSTGLLLAFRPWVFSMFSGYLER